MLPGQDFKSGAFTDTVCADETKNMAWSWCGQTMKLACVRGIAMRNFRLEVGGKVDDGDGCEWASEPTAVGTGEYRETQT